MITFQKQREVMGKEKKFILDTHLSADPA